MVASVQVSRKSVKTAERPKLLSLLAIIKEANELPRMDLPPGGASPRPGSHHPQATPRFRNRIVAAYFSLLNFNPTKCRVDISLY